MGRKADLSVASQFEYSLNRPGRKVRVTAPPQLIERWTFIWQGAVANCRHYTYEKSVHAGREREHLAVCVSFQAKLSKKRKATE
jgi:hypothetical protein